MSFASKWSQPIRWLHLGLFLTITAQLFLSLVMAGPDDKHQSFLEHSTLITHEYVGLVAATIILAHWLYLALAERITFEHLFPWSAAGIRSVISEVSGLLRGRLPDDNEQAGLAGFIHGLGLLLATAMGFTGTVMYFLLQAGQMESTRYGIAVYIHGTLANVMWAYWIGHGLMAIMHQLLGHDTLRGIFRLGR
ncbi:cytochrome b/b6 domain-containing protein [Acidihalobacter yilgarnensis]|uniref:cytochrome b/b6 domain-containing protein n=1 Tax=Acidihalobacter yilgarnensis TaxID=2819280 RepID=UPI0009F2602B|nr:cytochrome b/b6 domain-containing protein [Acidihalobacter yilgarnensis]